MHRKFGVPRNPIDAERSDPRIKPTPTRAHEIKSHYLQAAIDSPDTSDTVKFEVERLRAKDLYKKLDDQINSDFEQRFDAFLLGRMGPKERQDIYTKDPLWGYRNISHMAHPEVKRYINNKIEARAEFERYLAMLGTFGPMGYNVRTGEHWKAGLFEFYIYFKYILEHNDVSDKDYLRYYSMLEAELDERDANTEEDKAYFFPSHQYRTSNSLQNMPTGDTNVPWRKKTALDFNKYRPDYLTWSVKGTPIVQPRNVVQDYFKVPGRGKTIRPITQTPDAQQKPKAKSAPPPSSTPQAPAGPSTISSSGSSFFSAWTPKSTQVPNVAQTKTTLTKARTTRKNKTPTTVNQLPPPAAASSGKAASPAASDASDTSNTSGGLWSGVKAVGSLLMGGGTRKSKRLQGQSPSPVPTDTSVASTVVTTPQPTKTQSVTFPDSNTPHTTNTGWLQTPQRQKTVITPLPPSPSPTNNDPNAVATTAPFTQVLGPNDLDPDASTGTRKSKRIQGKSPSPNPAASTSTATEDETRTNRVAGNQMFSDQELQTYLSTKYSEYTKDQKIDRDDFIVMSKKNPNNRNYQEIVRRLYMASDGDMDIAKAIYNNSQVTKKRRPNQAFSDAMKYFWKEFELQTKGPKN